MTHLWPGRLIWLKFVPVILLISSLTGCVPYVRRRVLVRPPLMDLGQKRVIIGKFGGSELGISLEARQILIQKLKAIALTLIERPNLGIENLPIKNEEGDLVILGEATYYRVDTYLGPPERSSSELSNQIWYTWATRQTTTVTVNLFLKLVDAKTRKIILSKQCVGKIQNWTSLDIPWKEETAPPQIFLPEPVTSDVFEYRQIAIERAVSEFCSQFMPVYKWKWEKEALGE